MRSGNHRQVSRVYRFNVPLKNGGFYVGSSVSSEIEKDDYSLADDKVHIKNLIEKIAGDFDPADLYPDFESIEYIVGNWAILVSVGSELVPALVAAGEKNENVTARALMTRLLGEIVRDTKRRLGSRSSGLVCQDCFVRYAAHEVELSWIKEKITYYGCRSCGHSRGYFEHSGNIVAVLDEGMTESYAQGEEVRVNWLKYGGIFDFERVEIINATDESVERFSVQIGNDTDGVRRSKYEQVQYVISPDCRLSENTKRILRKTFAQVIIEVK